MTLHNAGPMIPRKDTKKTLTEDWQDRWSTIIQSMQRNYKALLRSLPDSAENIIAGKTFQQHPTRPQPAGSNGYVQFNRNGFFGAVVGFVWFNAAKVLSILGTSPSSAGLVVGDSAVPAVLYSGFGGQSSPFLEAYSNGGTFTSVKIGNNKNSAGALLSGIMFYNRGGMNEGTEDMRVGMITMTTAGGADSGVFAFYTTAAKATGPVQRLLMDSKGNLVPGTAALAINATDGFLYVTTCAGIPTGVPTTYTGRAAEQYDSTNNNQYVYNSGWKKIGFLVNDRDNIIANQVFGGF